MYYYNNQIPPQQGWICPKCGRVNAPWLPTCDCVSSQTSGAIRTNTDVWEYKGDGRWGKVPISVDIKAEQTEPIKDKWGNIFDTMEDIDAKPSTDCSWK